MVLLCCNCHVENLNFAWGTFFASAAPVAVGIIAIIFSHIQLIRTLNAKKIEEKRQDIYKKLNEFYGPFLQLRIKSNLLYKKFSSKFNSPGKERFATLTYLLNGHEFTGNDKILLEEIIKIGGECEKLIHRKAGLIDDTYLRTEVIPKATTHYLIIRLAYEGLLKGEADQYKDVLFPYDLDDLLEKRKKELENELKNL